MSNRPVALLLTSIALLMAGCASVVVDLGIGAERGRADVRWQVDNDGIVYLERAVRSPTGTVVMLHGLGGSKDHWTRFAARLPQGLRLIALDLPGFGESPKVKTASYAASEQVARLKRFVDVHGLRGFHLMGNSMGGRIAAEYALAWPGDVASLVLFDPAGATPGRLEERLGQLSPPTLVVWGARDRIIDPAVAQVWRAHLREGDVVMMADVGHAPMLERPEESAALVAVWWNRRKLF